MQGILISLATAIILAIAGAFAAPFVVDWNNWRGTFEREISAALGVPVSIRGKIDAELLPAPRMVLRNVTLGSGADARSATTGGTVQELDAELSLGGLIRGEIQATGVTLLRPYLRLVVDETGRIALPGGSGQAAAISIARMQVQGGTLDVRDEASGTTFTLGQLALNGDARSLSGPFRLDGSFVTEAGAYGLRSSLGELNGKGSGRLRLSLEGRNTPYDLVLDGNFQMADALPGFKGSLTLSHVAARDEGNGVDWRLTSNVDASTTQIDATGLNLSFGALATTAQLTGAGQLSLKPRIALQAELGARAFDLDAVSLTTPRPAGTVTDEAESPALRAVSALRQLLPRLSSLPAPDDPSLVKLDVGQLSVGGSLIHDVSLQIAGTQAGWHLSALEAAMPGAATLSASARAVPGSTERLEGHMVLASEDPVAFLRWAAPSAPRAYAQALSGPFRLETDISTTPDHITLQNMEGVSGEARMKGRLALSLENPAAPRLDASLSLEGFALDTLIPAAQNAALFAGHIEAGLQLSGQNLSFAGAPVARLQLDASAKNGGLDISRLMLDDPSGLHVEGHGALKQATAPPRGTFELSIRGPSAQGLPTIADILAGPEAAAALKSFEPQAAPVDLKATLVWFGLEGREARFSGTLGGMEGEARFSHDAGQQRPALSLSARMPDASALLEALQLPGASVSPGPAELGLTLTPKPQDDAELAGHLTLAGVKIEGKGEGRWENETFRPRLGMQIEGEDLGKLIPSLSVISGQAVPASLRFSLTGLAPSWRLDDISGRIGGNALSGALEINQAERLHLGGHLALDTLSLPHLLALFTADSTDAPQGQIWPQTPFMPPRLTSVEMDMKLSARTLSLLPQNELADGRMRLQVSPEETQIHDLSGAFGGGRIMVGARLRHSNAAMEANGRVMLEGVSLAALVQPVGASSPPDGKISLSVDLGGEGNSVNALVQSLSGQGTVSVNGLTIPATSPHAFQDVMAQTEKLETPPDEAATARLLDAALRRGVLTLPAMASTLAVNKGTVRLSPAHASIDTTRVMLGGTLDLVDMDLDARLDLEKPVGAFGVAGGSVIWDGPLEALKRKVTAVPLASALSMRTIERETQRLEQERLEGARRKVQEPLQQHQPPQPPVRTPSPPAGSTSPGRPAETPAPARPPAQPTQRPRPAAPSAQPATPPRPVTPPGTQPPSTQPHDDGIERLSLPPPGQTQVEPLPAPLPNYQPKYSLDPAPPAGSGAATPALPDDEDMILRPPGSIGLH